jgi:hypothetical protein
MVSWAPGTKRALGQFQKSNGMQQTARLDSKTMAALTGATDVGEE